MDEAWERAVETALDGQTEVSSIRTLTLDGAVKCLHGRLPPQTLLEKFQALEHLSIANIGVSSLENFPRLRNLRKLILSDNRIAGGLEFLVDAGLDSLRDLDLSNNRIQYAEDLSPLAQLRLVSLDLYECPVTRVKNYRSRVFGMIKSLKYLDKMDVDENERPESDEEEEDEEEEEEEVEEEEDPGSGEIDGEDHSGKLVNGTSTDGIVDAEEDEESDADEEIGATEHQTNGFRVAAASRDGDGDEEEMEAEGDDDDNSGEEIDEEEDDEEVVEVHEVDDSEEEEDGVEEDDESDEEEDVVVAQPVSNRGLTGHEGEIDEHDQDEEDENGEIGEEEEQEIEDDGEYEVDIDEGEDEEEDIDSEYLVRPVGGEAEEVGGSEGEVGNEDDGEEEVEDKEDAPQKEQKQTSTSQLKRKRDDGGVEDAKGHRASSSGDR